MFADPTGRRFRTLRIAGITATAVLAVCLGAVAIAMSGGPSAPFTQWAVPHQAAAGHSARDGAGQAGTTTSPAPSGGTRAAATAPAGGPAAPPSASAGATAAPSPSASASPAATNRAGRTPPGRAQTKSANPHAPASAA